MTAQDVLSGVHVVDINLGRNTSDSDRPDPGLVVRWRRRGDVWEALVTHEVDGTVTTEWLPALVLAPQERVISA
jgi:hypothetical protein